ncbi:pyridoxal phosphate-dependent aminotransferase [Streptomyces sp. NRRL F-5065]|uniref:pyridoxal phosphate-dependent aminotransferase n=1 Tax=Streptomyces sp. NRRL F-5065 TaxID=1463855 RepID=UPI0004C0D149|nr:aminotransferase class I/II-fold pyridoxal phosphate-dependent enzyme [Streptomyces sp. NRRL F-5065]
MYEPQRLQNLAMPALPYAENRSLRELERELGQIPLPDRVWDLTGADTHVFPPPEYAIEEMTKAAAGAGATYTPYRGDLGVRRTVAANLEAHFGLRADPTTQVILTPGTQSGLFAALSALVDENVSVIVPDPDYLLTERMVRYLRGNVVRVPMDFSDPGAPTLDLAAVEEALRTGARVFVFSNPNNPSGGVYGQETLEGLARLLVRYDAHAIADQLYSRLLYDGTKYVHLAQLPGMAQRTVTLFGPSKTESLSGFRLGVAVAPEGLTDAMEDILCISAMRAPAYAQHALSPWLDLDVEAIRKRVGEYQTLRDLAVEKLRASPAFEVYVPQGTSYVFPRVTDTRLEDQQIATALRRAGVVINPGYQFGARGRGHIRICVAQDSLQFTEALLTIITVTEGLVAG